MFRLLKLEDRIVLDGAMMLDALDEFEDREEQAEALFDMAADNDGPAFQDVDSGDSPFDMDMPLFDGGFQDADAEAGLRVLVISSDVNDADSLAAAARDGVRVVRYDAESVDLDELAGLIEDALAGETADSIAFAAHNTGVAQIQLTRTEAASLETLDGEVQRAFWTRVGGMLDDSGRIDLLACNVVDTEDGESFVAELESLSGADVAASVDNTGNEVYGGNWVLESPGVDVRETYFDADRLEDFEGVLNNNAFAAGELSDQNAEVAKSFSYVVPADTFQDPDGDPLSYRFTTDAAAPWLKFYTPTRVFYGKPGAGDVNLAGITVTLEATDVPGDFANAAALDFELKVADVGTLPVYNNPPAFYIPERSLNGTPVGDPVTVSSPGTGASLITYEILSQKPQGGIEAEAFRIDASTGQLAVNNGSLLVFDEAIRWDLTLKATNDLTWFDTARAFVYLEEAAFEDPSVIRLEFGATEFAENGGQTTLFAYNSDPVNEEITVELSFGGTATLFTDATTVDPDYTVSEFSIAIPANASAGSITLTGLSDNIVDPDDTVVVSISNLIASNAVPSTVPGEFEVTATILDETPAQVKVAGISATRNEINESAFPTTSQILVTLQQPAPAGGVTIELDFSGTGLEVQDLAERGLDYTTPGTSVFVPAGSQISSSLTITAVTDFEYEPQETIAVAVKSGSPPVDAAGVPPALILLNDNTPPEVRMMAENAVIYEDAGAGPQSTPLVAYLATGETAAAESKVFVEFTGDAELGATRDYTVTLDGTAGVTPVTGGGGKTLYPIVIPAGESAGQIYLTARMDGEFEGFVNERIVATLIQAQGALDLPPQEAVTVEIVDADAADAPVLDLFVRPGQTEGAFAETGTLRLDVDMDRFVGTDVKAYLEVAPVLAEAGYFELDVDYTAKYEAPGQAFDGQTVTVGADGRWEVPIEDGYNRTTILLAGITDTSFEGPETAEFSMVDFFNAIPGTSQDVVVTLNDSNDSPTLTLTLGGASEIHEDPAESVTSTVLNLTVTPGADGASPGFPADHRLCGHHRGGSGRRHAGRGLYRPGRRRRDRALRHGFGDL
jgi:hypothetical protein